MVETGALQERLFIRSKLDGFRSGRTSRNINETVWSKRKRIGNFCLQAVERSCFGFRQGATELSFYRSLNCTAINHRHEFRRRDLVL